MFAYKILNKRRNEGVEEETLPSLHRKQLNERAHWKNLNTIFVLKDGLYSSTFIYLVFLKVIY